MARGLKFRIETEEGLYYLCSENKGADQLRGYRELICVFVFAYAKHWFSHDGSYVFVEFHILNCSEKITLKLLLGLKVVPSLLFARENPCQILLQK